MNPELLPTLLPGMFPVTPPFKAWPKPSFSSSSLVSLPEPFCAGGHLIEFTVSCLSVSSLNQRSAEGPSHSPRLCLTNPLEQREDSRCLWSSDPSRALPMGRPWQSQ